MHSKVIGKRFEVAACDYLSQKGFIILETNFTLRGGEIDIVTRYKQSIVFVEVKARKDEIFMRLEETVSPLQQRRLTRSSQVWLHKHHMDDVNWRIDFVGILYDQNGVQEIRHIENAINWW